MPIIARNNSGPQFEPAPEGLHHAVCVDVIYLGEQDTPYGIKEQTRFIWQIDVENEVTGNRYQVRQTYNLTMSEMSKLSQHLEGWRNKQFTEEERVAFDVEKLIGVNCQLQLIHRTSKAGRVYANIQAVVPAPKGVTPMVPLDYERSQREEEESVPFPDGTPDGTPDVEIVVEGDNGEDLAF